MMHKYAFEPRSLIAWLRICRPGSIIGQQQAFMSEAYYRIRMLKTVAAVNGIDNGMNDSSAVHGNVVTTFGARKASH